MSWWLVVLIIFGVWLLALGLGHFLNYVFKNKIPPFIEFPLFFIASIPLIIIAWLGHYIIEPTIFFIYNLIYGLKHIKDEHFKVGQYFKKVQLEHTSFYQIVRVSLFTVDMRNLANDNITIWSLEGVNEEIGRNQLHPIAKLHGKLREINNG